MDNNADLNSILKELKNGKSKKEAEDYLMSQLNSRQTKKLHEVLNDEKAMNEMLNSPEARRLFKKLTGEDNG